MSDQTAHIDSPEVIRDFRNKLVAFDKRCEQVIFDVRGDVQRTLNWLEQTQTTYWKQQLRKYDELVRTEKNRLVEAQYAKTFFGKPSDIEEQKALKKAERLRLEAEEKLAAVNRWSKWLAEKAEKVLGPIDRLNIFRNSFQPRALARLDAMTRNLEGYFGTASANTAQGEVEGGGEDGGKA